MNHGKTGRIWTISPANKIEGEARAISGNGGIT
jgi:hypothetical protein